MAHMTMQGVPRALHHTFDHLHLHIEVVGLTALAAGLLCGAVLAAAHCYGAALMAALTGFVVFRAVDK